jgi:hypothetical protein
MNCSKRGHASGTSSISDFLFGAFVMTSESSGLDDDYKLAFGIFVMEASKLDSKLTEIIAALTEMDIVCAMITVHHQQFSNKLDSLRALFRIIYPDEDDPKYQPIREMLDQIKEVGDFRNSIVHALWRVEDGVPQTVRFHARGKLTRSVQPASYEKIRQYTVAAIELAGDLSDLAKAYRGFAKIDSQS